MAPKRVADLQQEIETKDNRIAALEQQVAEGQQQLALEKANSANLAENVKRLLAKLEAGDIATEQRFANVEKKIADLQRQPATATAAPGPYLAAARAAPLPQPGQGRQTTPPPTARQPRRPEPAEDIVKFVIHASADRETDKVMITVRDLVGFNTAAIYHVEKLTRRAASRSGQPRAASQPAAAPPSTSAQGAEAAAPAARIPMAVFVFSTSKYVADKAVKGDLRQKLRDGNIPMYVDDYLNREEQEERKKRVEEKLQLKKDGVKVAWRKAALWRLDTVDDKSTWSLVPALGAGGAAAPAPVAT
jgi:hypothetical protein